MVETDRRIPNTYSTRRKGKLYTYVRVQHQGRKAEAPLSNEWLNAHGGRARKKPEDRAQAIGFILLEKLRSQPRCALGTGRRLRLSNAVSMFLEEQDGLAEVRRPSQGQRERRRSVLLQGTERRGSFVGFLRDPWLDAVTTQDLEAFERSLEGGGYARESLRSYMADVRRFLSWCLERRLLAADPAGQGRYRLPPSGHLDPNEAAYSRDEMAALREAVRGYPLLERMFLVISRCGLRRQEYLDLTGELVLRDGLRTIWVPGARKNRERETRYRVVPVPQELAEELRPIMLRRDDYLATGTSKPLSGSALGSALRRFRKRTGLHLEPQRLRRTYAQRLLDAGTSIQQATEWMGNTPRTLKRWYAEPSVASLSYEAERALSLTQLPRRGRRGA